MMDGRRHPLLPAPAPTAAPPRRLFRRLLLPFLLAGVFVLCWHGRAELPRLGKASSHAPVTFGPVVFEADAGEARNVNRTEPQHVTSRIEHFDANGINFGSVQYSRAIDMNGGNPAFTMGFLLATGVGVNRDIHWHARADEWAYVIKGSWTVAMAAPSRFGRAVPSVPWAVTRGVARAGAAWFFPANWWHTLTCSALDGCAAILFFNNPPSIEPEPNSPQLAHAVHGMPVTVAAHALGVDVATGRHVQERIAGGSRMDPRAAYLDVAPITRTDACSRPGFVGDCPHPASEAAPAPLPAAVADFKDLGTTRIFPAIRPPGDAGCTAEGAVATAWDLTAANGMPILQRTARLGRAGVAGPGISGQLVELGPGATRPPVWTLNADAVIFVVEGAVRLWIYAGDVFNGFAPADDHPVDSRTQVLDLGTNAAAFVPVGHVYYFTAAACEPATVTLAFNHPEWEEINVHDVGDTFAHFEVGASLNDPDGGGQR